MYDTLREIINKLPTSKPIFQITFDETRRWGQFERKCIGKVSLPEPKDFLEGLVYKNFREVQVQNRYKVDDCGIINGIKQTMFNDLKAIYVKYNKISQFRRTKFSKLLSRAEDNRSFAEAAFKLYMFCGKVGITPANASSHACAEYIASEYKSLGEKYGS